MMNALVVFESQFGNTRHVAEVVAKRLEAYGKVHLTPYTAYTPALLEGVDLLVLGGPTQAHGVTVEMRRFMSELKPPARPLKAAAFDTRVKGPLFLWGSAAREIAVHLERNGFTIVAPPESFLVTLSKEPVLHAGEERHAQEWAARLGAVLGAPAPVAVGARRGE